MSFWEQVVEFLAGNWKTTVTGFVAALATFLANYGIDLSAAAQSRLNGWIMAAGMLLIGIFAKDGDKNNTNG